jgi:hypothetical protein
MSRSSSSSSAGGDGGGEAWSSERHGSTKESKRGRVCPDPQELLPNGGSKNQRQDHSADAGIWEWIKAAIREDEDEESEDESEDEDEDEDEESEDESEDGR